MNDVKKRDQKTKEQKRALMEASTQFAFEDEARRRQADTDKSARLRDLREAADQARVGG